MENRFPVVTVDPSSERFLEEEVRGVLQEGGPDTGGQLLQEEGSQFASHRGKALLRRGIISGIHKPADITFLTFIVSKQLLILSTKITKICKTILNYQDFCQNSGPKTSIPMSF